MVLKETLFEFDNFSYEIGSTGKIRYQGREGFNDDIVIAHALAIWSLNPLYKLTMEKPKTRLQNYYERQVQSFNEDPEERLYHEWATE